MQNTILKSLALAAFISSFWIPASAAKPKGRGVMKSSRTASDSANTESTPIPIRARTLTDFKIIGNDRIEKEAIIAYIGLTKGSMITDTQINLALKTLFSTELFFDVKLKMDQDGVLIATVKENPIINEIKFDGNKKASSDNLKSELQLKTRQVYVQEKLRKDTDRIIAIYNKLGYFGAKVSAKAELLKNNRIDITYYISEGNRATIRNIFLKNNNEYSNSDLLEQIAIRKKEWYHLFGNSFVYDRDKTSFSAESLRTFYANNGYADFKIAGNLSEFLPKTNEFDIYFTLEEGIRYKINDITVKTTIKDLNLSQVQQKFKVKKGQWYSEERINQTSEDISENVSNLGFAFNKINVALNRNTENKTIDVEYTIEEGPRVYIHNIVIHGNSATADHVIRRELTINEGDPYNILKIRRSRQKIENLGYFAKVEIKEVPTSVSDRINLEVSVEEKSTGQVNFAIGFSTFERLLGSVQLSKSNLFGLGYDTNISYQQSQYSQYLSTSFVNPYLLGSNLALSTSVFMNKSNNTLYTSFRSSSKGYNLKAGYHLTEYLTHSLIQSYRHDDIESFANNLSSIFIRDQQGKRNTYTVGESFFYDRLNSRIYPTKGYLLRYEHNLGAFGGENQYIINSGGLEAYHPIISENWIGSFKVSGGKINGINKRPVNISMRYSLGGYSLRGYQFNGVGPRVADMDANGNPIMNHSAFNAYYGNTYYTGSFELRFPNPFPKEFGFKTSVFYDFGSLYGFDGAKTITNGTTTQTILDSKSIRTSAGLAMTWQSPMGLISFSWAKALKHQEFDATQTFLINFGGSAF